MSGFVRRDKYLNRVTALHEAFRDALEIACQPAGEGRFGWVLVRQQANSHSTFSVVFRDPTTAVLHPCSNFRVRHGGAAERTLRASEYRRSRFSCASARHTAYRHACYT